MRKFIYCSVVFLVALLLVPGYFSGLSAKEDMECAYMMVTPSALSLGSGSSEDVTITVLNKEKKPVPNHSITIITENPDMVAAEPRKVMTDKDGKAMVKIKGLASLDYWPLNINLDCKEHSVSIHVD